MEEHDPDIQRLGGAVNKAGVRPECPACGHVGAITAERPVLLPASGKFPEGFTALAMTCEHCGHIRLFAVSILDKFMDPREE